MIRWCRLLVHLALSASESELRSLVIWCLLGSWRGSDCLTTCSSQSLAILEMDQQTITTRTTHIINMYNGYSWIRKEWYCCFCYYTSHPQHSSHHGAYAFWTIVANNHPSKTSLPCQSAWEPALMSWDEAPLAKLAGCGYRLTGSSCSWGSGENQGWFTNGQFAGYQICIVIFVIWACALFCDSCLELFFSLNHLSTFCFAFARTGRKWQHKWHNPGP